MNTGKILGRASVAAAVLAAITLLMIQPWYDQYLNPVFWGLANIIPVYIAVVMTAFVGLYFFGFTWDKYSSSRSIMYFTTSLLGIMILVVIGIFSSRMPIWIYPIDVFVWRPLLRVAIYLWVATTVSHLLSVLWTKYRTGDATPIEFDPKTAPRRLH